MKNLSVIFSILNGDCLAQTGKLFHGVFTLHSKCVRTLFYKTIFSSFTANVTLKDIPDNKMRYRELSNLIKGDVSFRHLDRVQHATDASAYREKPLGVVWPRDESDLQLVVEFAHRNKIAITPRGAGTSLAGQVVGNGMVVNMSKLIVMKNLIALH